MSTEIGTLTLQALRRVLRAAERASRDLAQATGLTPSQLLVLREIKMLQRTTPTEIATSLRFSQATITTIVALLHNRGLVGRQRSERDRRQSILYATDAGRELLGTAPDSLQTIFIDSFEGLPLWEQAMILSSVEKLALLLGEKDRDAAPLLDSGQIDRPTPVAEKP